MLSVIAHAVVPAGEGGSRNAGPDMEDAFALVAGVGDPFAASDQNGFSVEFADGGLPFRLEVKTRERHPRLGHGLLILLRAQVPVEGIEAVRTALGLNERELNSFPRTHSSGRGVRSRRGSG
jgi:hypothetical protein